MNQEQIIEACDFLKANKKISKEVIELIKEASIIALLKKKEKELKEIIINGFKFGLGFQKFLNFTIQNNPQNRKQIQSLICGDQYPITVLEINSKTGVSEPKSSGSARFGGTPRISHEEIELEFY